MVLDRLEHGRCLSMGEKEVLQMKQVKRKLYRCVSKDAPSLYVGGRMGSWGQMVSKKNAWKRTRYWWNKNLSPQGKKYFKLELVGNGRRMDSR